jgi:hypothetical protein
MFRCVFKCHRHTHYRMHTHTHTYTRPYTHTLILKHTQTLKVDVFKDESDDVRRQCPVNECDRSYATRSGYDAHITDAQMLTHTESGIHTEAKSSHAHTHTTHTHTGTQSDEHLATPHLGWSDTHTHAHTDAKSVVDHVSTHSQVNLHTVRTHT